MRRRLRGGALIGLSAALVGLSIGAQANESTAAPRAASEQPGVSALAHHNRLDAAGLTRVSQKGAAPAPAAAASAPDRDTNRPAPGPSLLELRPSSPRVSSSADMSGVPSSLQVQQARGENGLTMSVQMQTVRTTTLPPRP